MIGLRTILDQPFLSFQCSSSIIKKQNNNILISFFLTCIYHVSFIQRGFSFFFFSTSLHCLSFPASSMYFLLDCSRLFKKRTPHCVVKSLLCTVHHQPLWSHSAIPVSREVGQLVWSACLPFPCPTSYFQWGFRILKTAIKHDMAKPRCEILILESSRSR